MTRIALFGGAFDPPHHGHASVIAGVLRAQVCDQLWVVPSGVRSDKRSTLGAHRLAMTTRMLDESFPDEGRLKVFTDEVEGKVAGEGTVALYEWLERNYPPASYSLIIGQELVRDLPRWRRAGELRQMVSFLVVPRPGYPAHEGDNSWWNLTLLDVRFFKSVAVSSTAIRESLRVNPQASHLHHDLSSRVRDYILTHKLYHE